MRQAVGGGVLCCVVVSSPAAAQSAEGRWQALGAVVRVHSGEFGGAEIGVAGRVAWHLVTAFGVEAELGVYPGELGDPVAFSRRRVEGLFGATVGPRRGRVRPFASVRPGFVRFAEAPGPIASVAIFPPPLLCRLSAGATVFALGLGRGLDVFPGGRTVVRVEAGDRLMKYPGPAPLRGLLARPGGFLRP